MTGNSFSKAALYLMLAINIASGMQLFVRDESGDIKSYDVQVDTTAMSLYHAAWGQLTTDKRLFLQGKEIMYSVESLADLGITSESTIEVAASPHDSVMFLNKVFSASDWLPQVWRQRMEQCRSDAHAAFTDACAAKFLCAGGALNRTSIIRTFWPGDPLAKCDDDQQLRKLDFYHGYRDDQISGSVKLSELPRSVREILLDYNQISEMDFTGLEHHELHNVYVNCNLLTRVDLTQLEASEILSLGLMNNPISGIDLRKLSNKYPLRILYCSQGQLVQNSSLGSTGRLQDAQILKVLDSTSLEGIYIDGARVWW